MSTLRDALCLHAQCGDLKFLNPVRNRLAKLLGSKFRSYELADQASHAAGLLALRQASNSFVVIFAHGSGDYLRGGGYISRITGEVIEVERFITRKDLAAFERKVIFCMSCDSDELAEASLAAGAIAFVGFGQILFNRFNAAEEPTGSYVLVKHCQEKLIAPAITAALERFVTGRSNLEESIDYLRLWITKSAVSYVEEYTSVKERREMAALFLRMKEGIRYHGPRGIRFQIT